MTIEEKLKEIEQVYQYWLGTYARRELSITHARIICESICKAIILKLKMETVGTQIIMGKKPVNDIGGKDEPLKLWELIEVLKNLQEFRHYEHIRLQLELIRNKSNPGSHSANTPADLTAEEDLELCNVCLTQILTWFFERLKKPLPESIQDSINQINTKDGIPHQRWQELLSVCSNFDRNYQYILVASDQLSIDTTISKAISHMPWRLVLDLDPLSDVREEGLLHQFDKTGGKDYRKVFTIENRPDFDPKYPHYWFMANGLGSAVAPINDTKLWRSKYSGYLSNNLYQAFNKGSMVKARIVVMINVPANEAAVIIAAFNLIDEANLKFILCHETERYDYIFENFSNVELISISPKEIAKGVENSIQFDIDPGLNGDILIPIRDESKQKRYIDVQRADYDYLNSLGIEVVFKDIEQIVIDSNNSHNFYRGATVSWQDFAYERDISRNCIDGLKKRIQGELDKNRLNEIEFVHEAGAGGTTVGRRVTFDLSKEFPTVVLRKYEAKKTIAGLRILYDKYTKGSLPLLILTEAFEIRDTRQLHRDLANANKNAVILVIRRGSEKGLKDKKNFLRAQLELDEARRFTERFSTLVPSRGQQVRSIVADNRQTPNYVSPFLFGLVAYDGEFKGLDQYIEKSISEASLEQKKLLGFIGIIYHFTQRAVAGELFATLLGVDRNDCDLVNVLGSENPLFDLLHEDYDGNTPTNTWRPRYASLGKEMMKVLLGGSVEHKENWKANLGVWLMDMIKFINEAMPYLDEETLAILDALFINRIESDTEEQSRDFFTDLISFMLPNEGERLFEALTKAYPDVAHFHGHFARYLYHDKVGIKDYKKAIEQAEYSLDLLPHDSSLIHTLGMCYREQAEHLISQSQYDPLLAQEKEDEVKDLVDQSCEQFDHCIEIETNTVYGYESQIRIILKALDFGFKAHSASKREFFISNPQNEWYSKKLDKVGVLLEEALFIIDQATGLENKTKLMRSAGYIQDCEANLLKTLGRSLAAKDKFESLAINTPAGYQYMRPHFRRMFVMCLLASKTQESNLFDAWDKISEAELNKSVAFLSDNIFEDSPNPQNIRLWLQAIRFASNAPTIEECLSRIGSWTQMAGQTTNTQLEGYYYLYVLNAIKAINRGAGFDPSNVQNVKDLKEKMRGFVKNEKHCFEWYGNGDGIRQMVNHKVLGEYGSDFIERNSQILKRVSGRVKEVSSSQHGLVVLDCGLEAFFVPSVNRFLEKNKNDRITCYIGFRYDQIQAWDVQLIDLKISDSVIHTTVPLEDTLEKKSKSVGTDLNSIPLIVPSKVYKGVIESLDAEKIIGIIAVPELSVQVSFSRKHLSNFKFNRLSLGMPVEVTIRINENGAVRDVSSQSLTAQSVRVRR